MKCGIDREEIRQLSPETPSCLEVGGTSEGDGEGTTIEVAAFVSSEENTSRRK